MFDEKYEKLAELKRKNTIGILLIILGILLYAAFLIIIIINYPELINNTILKGTNIDSEILVFPFAILLLVLIVITFVKLCHPYSKYSSETLKEVKNYILKEELNNTFNDSYNEENIEELNNEFDDNNIGYGESSDIDDYFSIRLDNNKIYYADVRFYHHSDDSTVTTYEGPMFIFNTKEEINGDLYIATKEKLFLFGNYSNIESIINKTNLKEIEPTTNTFNKNIYILSSANPSIIEDTKFQEVINNYMTDNDNKYMFIYKANKLYILNFNYDNNFEAFINSKITEDNAREQMKNEAIALKEELEKILNNKEVLNIKDYN